MFTTEKELSALLGEVEKEFSAILAKAETTLAKSEEVSLAKAEDEKKDEKKDDKSDAKEDEKKEDKSEAKEDAPAEKQEAAPQAEGEASQEQPQAPAAEAQADAAQADQGHGYDEEDMAHMQAMYASMSREELIAHHDAIKAVLDGMQAQAAPAAAPEMEAQAQAPMIKSEQDPVIEVKPETIQTSQETELLKSELASKDAKITELSKTLEAVTAFVTKLVEKKAAPAGKAITQLDTITKSEMTPEDKTLSKQEITAKLSVKASDPKLEKSDREAINAYYATGQINLTGISHLLK